MQRARFDWLTDELWATDTGPHLPFLYLCVLGLQARVVVEIGVREGCTTRALLEGVALTGGRLYSCDVADCRGARHVPEHLHRHWEFTQQASHHFLAEWARPIELALIDGDHCEEAVRGDWRGIAPWVRPGGLVCFHDSLGPCHELGATVQGVVEQDVRPHPDWEMVNLPWSYGLAVCRRVR